MPEKRWRARSPQDIESARGRLVDAAERCFERDGVSATSIGDVAGEAGIARASIYRYFPGGRDELVLAVFLREADRAATELREFLAGLETFEELIVEGTLHGLHLLQAHPKLAVLFHPDVAGATSAIAGDASAAYELAAEFLAPILDEARRRGQMRPDVTNEDAAEWIVRVVLSLAATPGPRRRSTDEQRAFLRQFLWPTFAPSRRPRRSGPG